MILKNNHFFLLRKPIQVGIGDYTTQPTVYNAWWFGSASTSKTATIAFTLDSISVDASATLGHTATLFATLSDVTVASSATLGHSLSMAVTLDSISTAISATVSGGASLTATMDVTLDSLSVASSATLGHTGTLSATLSDISFASSATLGHSLAMAVTLDSISTNISATVATAGSITGTMAVTLDGIGFAATANVQSQVIVVDTHDGDYHKKKFQKEISDKARRKQQIIDAYEELVELKPKAAADVIAPFVPDAVQSQNVSINFETLLKNLDRADALYNSLQRELQEIDDEEVFLLL